MMKVLLFSLILTAICFASEAQDAIVKAAQEALAPLSGKGGALGVLPLQYDKNPEEGKMAAEIVVGVAQSIGLTVVERGAMQKVMQEQALGASGMVSESSAGKIGELLAAKYLVVGTIGPLLGKENLSLRVIEVETGKLISTSSAQLKQGELAEVRKELLGEAGQTSAVVFRSLLMPGWGQFYADAPVRGTLWSVSGLGLLGVSIWATLNASDKETLYTDYIEDQTRDAALYQREKLRFCQEYSCGLRSATDFPEFTSEFLPRQIAEKANEYHEARDLRNLFWITTASVWTLNVLDAWWLGSQRKEKFDLYFSALPTGKESGVLQVGFNF